MYRCLPICLLPLFQWSLLYRYYNSNFFSKWFKNILRTFEAEIAQNLRTPSFNLKNVVLIKKKNVYSQKMSIIPIIHFYKIFKWLMKKNMGEIDIEVKVCMKMWSELASMILFFIKTQSTTLLKNISTPWVKVHFLTR